MTLAEFSNLSQSPGNARGIAIVTPADADLSYVALALQIGTSGTLRVTCADGTTVDLPASIVTDGFFLPAPVVRVHLTGTTAGNILAFK